MQYYEANGVYYKQVIDDKGKTVYVVAGKDGVLNTDASVTDPNATIAAPKVGDIVNQLPDDCRKIILNGKRYYVSPNGIYYEKVTDPDGNTGFKITALPDENEKGAE
jgi:glucan-binding YG repeat protein